jgi:release factor glutamine methyltransferase
MTILEVIQRSADYLGKHGVDSPRLQAELLLAHLLGMPQMRLYLEFERMLGEPELTALWELVKRRGRREPLQHLVGSVSFCGLELAVSRHVLVPRPETELLAEAAWGFLESVEASPSVALDLCTGSGCLAIALAAKCPRAEIHAADLSPEALGVARGNAVRHGVAARIAFHEGDLFMPLPAGLLLDLIVSNPPYIPAGDIATLDPEVRDWDPRLALDGGEAGLDFYRRIAAEGLSRLQPGGRLLAEFGDGQAEGVSEIFTAAGWRVNAVRADLTGQPRIVIASADGS